MVVSALQRVRPRPGPPETLRALPRAGCPVQGGREAPVSHEKEEVLVSACSQRLGAFGHRTSETNFSFSL